MALENESDEATKVCGNRQVTLLVQRILGKPAPISIDFAPANLTSKQPMGIAMTMIGTAVAVLMRGAPEL